MPPIAESDRTSTLPTHVHIASLGYTSASSIKGESESGQVLEVFENACAYGWNWADSPVLVTYPGEDVDLGGHGVTAPWAGLGQMRPFSIGVAKGMQRITALHTGMLLVLDAGVCSASHVAWASPPESRVIGIGARGGEEVGGVAIHLHEQLVRMDTSPRALPDGQLSGRPRV